MAETNDELLNYTQKMIFVLKNYIKPSDVTKISFSNLNETHQFCDVLFNNGFAIDKIFLRDDNCYIPFDYIIEGLKVVFYFNDDFLQTIDLEIKDLKKNTKNNIKLKHLR